MKNRVQTPNIFYKFCTLANFHNCLINKLTTNLQIPSNFVLNRNYGQFCVLSPLFRKYGNSGPDHNFFQKFCSILNFIIALLICFQRALDHRPTLFQTQILTNLLILQSKRGRWNIEFCGIFVVFQITFY